MTQRIWIHNIEDWKWQEAPLSLMGPTGSGKTRLALDFVQKKFKRFKDVLLLSVDAVSAYKELDIGSAKVRGHERSDFDWAGLDLVSPKEEMSAALFLDQTREVLEAALNAQRPVILVGGSHFYEKALVDGLAPGQKSDPHFIETLKTLPNEELKRRLLLQDARFEKIHINDRYRLERFLDLSERQKIKFEALNQPRENPYFEKVFSLALGTNVNLSEYEILLKNRIRKMFDEGWVEECRSLLEKYGMGAQALESVGYFQICDAIQKNRPIDDTLFEKVLISHRQLAKKQRTWIRGLLNKSSNH